MLEKNNLKDLASRSEGAYSLTIFQETPRISSYLYAIAAGPWHAFTSKKEGYPEMRILCRASLKEYVRAE